VKQDIELDFLARMLKHLQFFQEASKQIDEDAYRRLLRELRCQTLQEGDIIFQISTSIVTTLIILTR
jgi:hypothetical protein